MAVESSVNKIKLALKYEDGFVGEKQKLKSRSYTVVNITATDQDLYDTAKIIESLSTKQLMHVFKDSENSLVEV